MVTRKPTKRNPRKKATRRKAPAKRVVKPALSPRLQQRVDFARKHWRSTVGPFEVTPGEWLLEHMWRPLTEFKLWPVDKERCCSTCRARVGEYVPGFFDAEDTLGHAPDCAGLEAVQQQFVLLHLPRQEGKTTGASGYIAGELFEGLNEDIQFIAGNEDKSDELFWDHYCSKIKANEDLDEITRIVGNEIFVPLREVERPDGSTEMRGNCRFRFSATSVGSAVGASTTKLLIDEARAVPADVFAALTATVLARNGWRCPHDPNGNRGHTKTIGDLDKPTKTQCDACGERLEPWLAQIIVLTSAGELTGGSKDWFFELIDALKKHPVKRTHFFEKKGAGGKYASRTAADSIGELFALSDALKTHADIELGNEARRKGEDFLTDAEINRVIDKTLVNQEFGSKPAVAFLDTASTIELLSLVILEDDSPADAQPFTRVATSRIDVWDPKKETISEQKLEAHLDKYVPVFKILDLCIDDRGQKWVQNWVAHLRQKPWGKIVRGAKWINKHERRAGYLALEAYILGAMARLQDHKILRAELKSARRKYDSDGLLDVREERRRVHHLDVVDSLASCCLLLQEQLRRRGPTMTEMLKSQEKLQATLAKMGVDIGGMKFDGNWW